MRKLIALSLLLLFSCGGPVQPPPTPGTYAWTNAWLKEREGLYLGCEGLTHEDPAAVVDCVLIFKIFNEFRERYAVWVDPAGRNVKMGAALWHQGRSTIDARGVPILDLGGGAYAQAYFVPNPPFVQWANPHAVGCEALHLFHFVLHGAELRPEALREGTDQHVYAIIGHDTPDDPMMFRCWEDASNRYLEAQRQ